MKQTLNFITPKKIRTESPFVADKIVKIWGLTCAVLMIYSVGYFAFEKYQSFSIAKAQKEQEDKKVVLADLTSSLGTGESLSSLEEEVKVLEKEKVITEKMLTLLHQQGVSDTSGFSERMIDLSEQHVAGTWYNYFKIKNEGKSLTFKGRTLQPDLVPVIVQNFKNSRHFQGKIFEYILIEQPKDRKGKNSRDDRSSGSEEETGVLSFVLQTEPKAEKEKGKGGGDSSTGAAGASDAASSAAGILGGTQETNNTTGGSQ